jgi:hypothetical protein
MTYERTSVFFHLELSAEAAAIVSRGGRERAWLIKGITTNLKQKLPIHLERDGERLGTILKSGTAVFGDDPHLWLEV